jgi:hypothetical protein
MPLKSPNMISRDAPFRRYKVTARQSWEQGYKTGEKWTKDYNPGGPYVQQPGRITDPDWVRYCAATRLNNEEWRRGFSEAQQDRSSRALLDRMGLYDPEHFDSHLKTGTWFTSDFIHYFDQRCIDAYWWCCEQISGRWIVAEMFSFADDGDRVLFDLNFTR